MKKVTSVLFFISLTLFSSGQHKTNTIIVKQENNLNNKIFEIKLTPTSGKRDEWEWNKDEISFNSDSLSSKIMSEKEKFNPAYCKTKTTPSSIGSTISFDATMQNPGGSKITWKGKATGDIISGTVVWKYLSGTSTYSFKGTFKK